MKVVVFLRADIVERGTDEITRLRRGVLRTDELERLQAEIAQFAVVAEGRSEGALQIALDVEIDDAAVSVGGGGDPYGREFLDLTVAPLVNGAVFDASDPKYRGPYDSVFVLHPALIRERASSFVLGVSASSIPVQAFPQPGELALAMADEWASHLAQRMRDLGFPVPVERGGASAFGASVGTRTVHRPDAFMAPDLWRAAGDRFAPTPAYQQHAAQDLAAPSEWTSARDNPFRLPQLDGDALAVLAGTPIDATVEEGRVAFVRRGASPDDASTFDPAMESSATLSLPTKRLLFVDWARADLFGSHLDPRLNPKVAGWLKQGDRLFVVFEIAPGPTEPEINLLQWDGISVQAPPVLRGGSPRLDSTPATLSAPAQGDLVRLTTPDGRSRVAAIPWVDPLAVDVPSSVLLAGESLALEVRASPHVERIEVAWEVPPDWQAPEDGPLKEGRTTWVFKAPPGPLEQEIRVVFTQPSSGWKREETILVERLASPMGLELAYGAQTLPATSGGFSASATVEGVGAVITEAPGSRGGRVLLLRRQGLRPVLHAQTHPYLELDLDGGKAEPLDLAMRQVGGKVTRIRLFDIPGALGAQPPQWSAVVGSGPAMFDLRTAGVTGAVEEVWIEAPEIAAIYERPIGVSSFVLRQVRVLARAEGPTTPIVPGTPVAPVADGETWQRAAAAALAPTASLMEDPRDVVALNAAAAARKKKVPELVPALGQLVRSLEQAVVAEAVEALAFQDTAEAWRIITAALDSGPSDDAREAAARALGRKGQVLTAAPLTSMIIARSWRARAAGAQALGALPGAEPAQLALVFLQDVHPAVRLQVVLSANMAIDPVARRIQYESVNDPSDWVRYASYLALTRSSLPGMAEEGYRGVRDDSPVVRLALLEAFRLHPAKESLGALRLAVADTDPRVRAAALRAFAVMPGDVTLEELGGVLEERDARIQAALVEVARSKNLVLPARTMQLLLESTDRTVAHWARNKRP